MSTLPPTPAEAPGQDLGGRARRPAVPPHTWSTPAVGVTGGPSAQVPHSHQGKWPGRGEGGRGKARGRGEARGGGEAKGGGGRRGGRGEGGRGKAREGMQARAMGTEAARGREVRVRGREGAWAGSEEKAGGRRARKHLMTTGASITACRYQNADHSSSGSPVVYHSWRVSLCS